MYNTMEKRNTGEESIAEDSASALATLALPVAILGAVDTSEIPSEWFTLYRVRRNQIRMIKDRGFALSDVDEFELRALSDCHMEFGSSAYIVMQSYAARAESMQTSIRALFNKVYYGAGLVVKQQQQQQQQTSDTVPAYESAPSGGLHGAQPAASTSSPGTGNNSNYNQSIMVYYADLPQKTKSQGVDSLKKIFEAFDTSGAMQLIIISEVDLGTQAQSNLSSLRLNHCWFFLDKHLLFNVTDHVLYSKHSIAKPSDIAAVKVSQLPLIKSTDVVARYFGFHRGQVVRIESTIPIPGLVVYKSITYRLVV